MIQNKIGSASKFCVIAVNGIGSDVIGVTGGSGSGPVGSGSGSGSGSGPGGSGSGAGGSGSEASAQVLPSLWLSRGPFQPCSALLIATTAL